MNKYPDAKIYGMKEDLETRGYTIERRDCGWIIGGKGNGLPLVSASEHDAILEAYTTLEDDPD